MDPVPGAVTRRGQILLDGVFHLVAHAALTATAERTGRPLRLFVQGSVHRAGPGPVCRREGEGADRLDRAVRHLLAGITPPPLRAALGRTLTHPSHVVLNPADEQQAAATPSTPAGAWLCNPEQAPENHHPGPDGPRPPLSCLAEWTSSGIATVVRMGEHDLSRRTLSNAVLRTVPCFCRTTDTTITRHHVPRPRGWKP
ncbi:hypothetical protein OIE73_01075 [Streptomyces hirsutus]|uniref:Uncharacterized protein n=1 Tax=Streptomyces hirsutus TaxID=35620 RepID=A0ABZ1GID3_9ACTN|nr:hypothetical protein [Streptomyces hirsutus]WSD04493.1 hypothetical protein OIE73_01075 [Streptomyces hirsutus]